MKGSNLASLSGRYCDAGLVWEEKITNSNGEIEVPKYGTFRVRSATNGLQVTIDGVLAMTMGSNEVETFNAGNGEPGDHKNTVTVKVSGGNCFVQVAREFDRK